MDSNELMSTARQRITMPPEWNRHRATWISWPRNVETWPHNLHAAQQEMLRLIETIAEGELVCVLAGGDAMQSAQAVLNKLSNVELFDIPTNDAWIRDYGPTFVLDSSNQTVAVNWIYNCWGEKYPPFDNDQQVAKRIAVELGLPCVDVDMVVEGGALEVNGEILLTTSSCLMNTNRNPKLTRDRLDESLTNVLGVKHVFWLPGESDENEIDGESGLPRDDTNGHIDQIARFISERRVLLAIDHCESQFYQSNRRALETSASLASYDLEIIDLPLPENIRLFDELLPASYSNFYICNRGVIVPQFGDLKADATALKIIGELVDVDVIPLPSLNLTWGLGSFHCLTQQEPEFV